MVIPIDPFEIYDAQMERDFSNLEREIARAYPMWKCLRCGCMWGAAEKSCPVCVGEVALEEEMVEVFEIVKPTYLRDGPYSMLSFTEPEEQGNATDKE